MGLAGLSYLWLGGFYYLGPGMFYYFNGDPGGLAGAGIDKRARGRREGVEYVPAYKVSLRGPCSHTHSQHTLTHTQ